ncbi:MAG: MFS transporter [Promethearchaeota archaeon]
MFRVMRVSFYAAIGCFFFLLFLPFWQGVWLFTFYGTLFGFVNCMVIQAMDTLSLRFAPPNQEGSVLGLYKFFTSLGAVIGPSLLLFMVQYIWPLSGVMLFPIIFTISGLIFIKYIRPMEKKLSDPKT